MMKPTRDSREPQPAKPQRFYSRPADSSLAAYKAWLRGMYEAVMGQAGLPIEEEDMTEEDWVNSWKNFWDRGDKEAGQK